ASLRHDPATRRSFLTFKGSATFLKLPRIADKLEKVPAGNELIVNVERLAYIDHACLDLLLNWEQQHAATGGKLTPHWEALNARSQSLRTGAASHPRGTARDGHGTRDPNRRPDHLRQTASH